MNSNFIPWLTRRIGFGAMFLLMLGWLAVPVALAEKPGWTNWFGKKKAADDTAEAVQTDVAKSKDKADKEGRKAAKETRKAEQEAARQQKEKEEEATAEMEAVKEKAAKAEKEATRKQKKMTEDAGDEVEKGKAKVKAEKNKTAEGMKELDKGSEKGQAMREQHSRKWWKFGLD